MSNVTKATQKAVQTKARLELFDVVTRLEFITRRAHGLEAAAAAAAKEAETDYADGVSQLAADLATEIRALELEATAAWRAA